MTHRTFRTLYGYKVLTRKDDFFLTSARINQSLDIRGDMVDLHLFYKPHQWTRAHPAINRLGFGILFFRKLADARFFTWAAREEIWKIEARWAHLPEVRQLACPGDLYYISAALNGQIFKADWCCWPRGSWMASRIKLLEKVE